MEIKTLNKSLIDESLQAVLSKVDKNLVTFRDIFPMPASIGNVYGGGHGNDCDWTQSFWTGMVWLAYELTKDDKYLELGRHHTASYKKRIDEKLATDTHDLGFLYTLSAVADYKITGNASAKQVAIDAADELMLRYKEKGEFIQAWGGDINDPNMYRLIIDCYMNLPLLFWASEVTGDCKYAKVATNHAHTARNVIIRDDNSTYHTYYFDPQTGEPTKGVTHQGYADDSCWSRGQAWGGVYGFALCYKYTKDPEFIEEFIKVTDYFIDHLPEDKVAYWDLCFTSGSEERDTSSASIAACGILEMIKYLDDEALKKKYELVAMEMMESLINNYTTFESDTANGLLFEGVYSKPGGNGVNEMTIWGGDYYFMEALVRLKMDWKLYW